MKPALTLALALLATPVAAQDLQYSDQATLQCLQAAVGLSDKGGCIGLSADACMEATPDGGTTVGMGYCLDRELAFWDGMLNQVYDTVRAKARAVDAEMEEIGATVPKTEPALRDMQRAWIPFRDATCDFERAQWGGGTGGGPATLSCLLRETAEQALYLSGAWIGE